MREWVQHQWSLRPWWMNLMLLMCIYMAVIYVPWDLFWKPVAIDEEVWFGIRFHGWAAKALAVPHWAVYAAGMVGFWRMARWMHPWAAVYAVQMTIAMIVWPLLYVEGDQRYVFSVASGVVFAGVTFALWRARPWFQLEPGSLRERYGSWALVTGASAGIGVAFARAFAKDGISLVLAARRGDRLAQLADELTKEHGVEVRIVSCDLATPDGVQACIAAAQDVDLAILVNNAGVGYSGRFERQDPERLTALVQLNCVAPVTLTAALLPKLRARGRGAIVFTGSVAGSQPLPLHAVYSASKSFDNLLAEGLWAELRGSGIDVIALEPGSTETEFQAVAEEIAHEGESAEKVVAVALRALGRQPSVVSGGFNWLRANAAMRLLPRPLLALVAKEVMERQTPEGMR
ncbi:MAG: SDR family NAD(P)-dependent oxidoreductase [Myxococcota bacterium]